MKFVTEWVEYKKRLDSYQASKAYLFAMEEIVRIRQFLRSIPMPEITVGDFQLIQSYLNEVEVHERRIKAFLTYYRAFPEN